jgi:secondary thiamine-phosphate synthase enzyme
MNRRLELNTTAAHEVINVTEQLGAVVHGIEHGLALYYTPHTTAALLLCEDDVELRQDLLRVAATLFAGGRPFSHVRNNNPNAEAHLLSALGGSSLSVAIQNGKLDLGAYQNILFFELDGPKRREIRCQIIAA